MKLPQFRTFNSIRNALQSESGSVSLLPPSRATPIQFQDPGNRIFELSGLSVFFRPCPQNDLMRRLPSKDGFMQSFLQRLCLLGAMFLASSPALFANTPALLRTVPARGCYCHCAESHARGGCVKLCDSKRYAASRWRATRCVKPHLQTPSHNSNAGPKFPHPGRAEHAKL